MNRSPYIPQDPDSVCQAGVPKGDVHERFPFAAKMGRSAEFRMSLTENTLEGPRNCAILLAPRRGGPARGKIRSCEGVWTGQRVQSGSGLGGGK